MSDPIQEALALAEKANTLKEVPIGAVIINHKNEIIGKGYNQKETLKDCTAHAEIIAIKNAQKQVNDWRLTGCTMISTLEPCPMCAGAILHARLDKIIYLAKDYQWGGVETKITLLKPNLFNHTTQYEYQAHEKAKVLLQSFFKKIRK